MHTRFQGDDMVAKNPGVIIENLRERLYEVQMKSEGTISKSASNGLKTSF
jgi:hypothetical protein